MKTYYNKRKRLHKKRDPPDWFGAPTWPPFYCFGKPIWRTWSHVKRVSESCHNLQCDLPWVPEVFLAYGGNLRCWPKADTSSAVGHSHEGRSRKKKRAGHYKDLTETGNHARKVSGTQGKCDRENFEHLKYLRNVYSVMTNHSEDQGTQTGRKSTN